MISTSTLVLLSLSIPLLHKLLSLLNNIRLARRTGLPYTLSPIHELEVWAYITNGFLRWACADYLMRGEGWPRWARFMVKDWMYEDKGRAHQEFGDVFLVVASGGIVCYVASVKSAMNIVTQRRAFPKPAEKMKMLEPFGPNVVSVEGDAWRKHIRITVPPFGEAVNKLVWEETFRQTNMLASSWANSGSGDLKRDIYSLTVNIMSCVGFGKPAEWTDDMNATPAGHSITLVSAIMGVVTNLAPLLLLPKWVLKHSSLSHVYEAYVEFEKYMNEYLNEEKQKIAMNQNYESNVKGNLLTAVLKSSTSGMTEKDPGKPSEKLSFTDEEVRGNVFMFLLAGYDTTANTLLFSSIVLALHQDIQNQIIQEVDRVYKEAAKEGRTELSFIDDLPKFRYILAFMYEVMRVFPIVIPIARMAYDSQHLTVESSTGGVTTHILPAQTGCIVNNTGLHYNTKYWHEPHLIEPRRWLTSSPNTYDPRHPTPQQEAEINAHDTPFTPNHVKGSFMTFNEGPRACLGKRFAQVEFVAFYARLLKQHRLLLGEGEDGDEMERVIRLRSGGSPVTLIPPMDVKVRLEER